MNRLVQSILSKHFKRVFTFAVDDFPGKHDNSPVDDLVGPPLASELGVFIVQERGAAENRMLIVDTDRDVTVEQIIEVFRRYGVAAHLVHIKEN
jgi:hypothetical protein